MQRILSVETSRNGLYTGGESVSKRLCCSFLIMVAFFGLLGGFLLGSFMSKRTHYIFKLELDDIASKTEILNKNIVSFLDHTDRAQTECAKLLCNRALYLNNTYMDTKQIINFANSCFRNG